MFFTEINKQKYLLTQSIHETVLLSCIFQNTFRMLNWIRLLRVNDYIKNSLIFFPAFFGGKIFVDNNLAFLTAAFFLFSLLASAVYIMNDLLDFNLDLKHPTKRERPITKGAISKPVSALVGLFLLLVAIGSSFFISSELPVLFTIYFVTNLFYSVCIKHIAPFDLLLIAFGFLLRIQVGGMVSATEISGWLYVMIFLFAITFGFAKRLEEIQFLSGYKIEFSSVRPSLKFYSAEFLRNGIIAIVSVAFVCYVMYVFSAETISRLHASYVFITCLPVSFGVYHYIVLVKRGNKSIAPQVVLRENLSIQFALLCWLLMMVYFIYRR